MRPGFLIMGVGGCSAKNRFFMQYIKNKINTIINKLEEPYPFSYALFAFLGITAFRNFLEIFSDQTPFELSNFLHFHFSYVAIVLAIVLIFKLITGKEVLTTARVVLPLCVLLFIAPTMDLIISKGEGFNISYFIPHLHKDLFWRFLTFGGDFPGKGVTPGMRIEIVVIMLLSYVYCRRSVSVVKSVISSFLMYILLFIFGCSEYILKFILESFGIFYAYNETLLVSFYLLLSLILIFLIVFIEKPKQIKQIFKSINCWEAMHYLLMFMVGIVAGSKLSALSVINNSNFFHLLLMIVSVFFVIVLNSQDKISRRYINICIAASLLIAAFVGFKLFYLLLIFVLLSFLYEFKPFELKNIPIIAEFTKAILAFFVILAAFVFFTGSVLLFPNKLYIFFLILVPLGLFAYNSAISGRIINKKFNILSKGLILPSYLICGLYFYSVTANVLLGLFFVIMGAFQLVNISRSQISTKKCLINYFISLILLIVMLFRI